jgi:VanZ family protein
MRRLLGHKVLTYFAVGYTVLLTIGSLINTGEVVETPNNFDKVVHLVAYFGLGFLWMIWFIYKKPEDTKRQGIQRLIIIVVLAVVYGIGIEVLQGVLTSYRIADRWDILANTIGAGLALPVVLLLINKSSMLKTKF